MEAERIERGGGLLAAGERFARTPGWFARMIAPGIDSVLKKFDQGIVSGRLRVELPGGETRVLGSRAAGFDAHLRLHDWRAVIRLAVSGSVGWYQAWEAGEWESDDRVALFALIGANAATLGGAARAKGPFRLVARMAHRLNRNSRSGAQRNIHAHYDLGNDFYAEWLDPSMTYSSARFEDAQDLDKAQCAKWDALAQRIGDAYNVLEIGCGWGSLADYLQRQGRQVTGISLSDEQLRWAQEHQHSAIHFLKQDYRDTAGQYDAIVSVEMVEALGREYWPTFMDCVARNLKPGGRATIQYISMRDELFDAYAASADFIQAYVFPGGLLVRSNEFRRLAEQRGLEWRNQTDFGLGYAETLKAWRERFDAAVAEGRLPTGFDDRFVGLWRYYLDYCEGGFRAGSIDVHQVTLIKGE